MRALRAEEESGRLELVLAGVVGRRTAFGAAMTAVGVGAVVLWLAIFLGAPGRRHVDVGGAAYLALALMSPAAVFAGVGALTSQLAPTRRGALGSAARRSSSGCCCGWSPTRPTRSSWLRWVDPVRLGRGAAARSPARSRSCSCRLRCSTALLVVAAGRIAERRDIGAGVLAARDSAPPSLTLLVVAGGPRAARAARLAARLARSARGRSRSCSACCPPPSSEGISKDLDEQFQKLGTSLSSAEGFLGLEFLFLILAVCVFVCFQLAGAREEEAEQRLETLLALPVGRRRWLAGRLAVAALAAAALALVAGLLAWAGAASAGAGVSLGEMLEAGVNCLPGGGAVPRPWRARLRGRATGQQRHRVRPGRRGVPVGHRARDR